MDAMRVALGAGFVNSPVATNRLLTLNQRPAVSECNKSQPKPVSKKRPIKAKAKKK